MNQLSADHSHPPKKIVVGKPTLGDKSIFLKLVDEILHSRQMTNGGSMVRRLEKKLCKFLGVRHCIPVCNATIGLQIACRALELYGEVITTPYTFPATPQAVKWLGLKPVFADISPEDHNIDPRKIEVLINNKTSAILGVHLWGRGCQVNELERIAQQNQIKLIYDAAHSFGNKINGTCIGNFGDCEVFSFHATKQFNTFEGGAIATNNDSLAKKIRLLKNHGLNSDKSMAPSGTNGKMSEIHAAMGLASLPSLMEKMSMSREKYLMYQDLLTNIPTLKMLDFGNVEQCNHHYVVVEIESDKDGTRRDGLHQNLVKHDIIAQKYFSPGCHRMGITDHQSTSTYLPVTDRVCREVLVLPTGEAVCKDDIRFICLIIRKFLNTN